MSRGQGDFVLELFYDSSPLLLFLPGLGLLDQRDQLRIGRINLLNVIEQLHRRREAPVSHLVARGFEQLPRLRYTGRLFHLLDDIGAVSYTHLCVAFRK